MGKPPRLKSLRVIFPAACGGVAYSCNGLFFAGNVDHRVLKALEEYGWKIYM